MLSQSDDPRDLRIRGLGIPLIWAIRVATLRSMIPGFGPFRDPSGSWGSWDLEMIRIWVRILAGFGSDPGPIRGDLG